MEYRLSLGSRSRVVWRDVAPTFIHIGVIMFESLKKLVAQLEQKLARQRDAIVATEQSLEAARALLKTHTPK